MDMSYGGNPPDKSDRHTLELATKLSSQYQSLDAAMETRFPANNNNPTDTSVNGGLAASSPRGTSIKERDDMVSRSLFQSKQSP